VDKTFFYLTVGLLFIIAISIYGVTKPTLKEECLSRGGTSVEVRGSFERCIEP
jgi:hypothetical protein